MHAIDLSCTLFDFLFRALDCASALGRIRRLQALHLLMAARQTSTVLTTAPPAPALPHELGDRSSRTRYSRLRVLHSFQVTSLNSSLFALIVRTKIAASTPPKAIAGIVTHPLAQLDITSLPRAFVSRLFKFPSLWMCSGAEFAAAGPASETDLLTSSLSRIVSYLPSVSRAPCVPQGTALRASSDSRILCRKRLPRQPPLRRLGTLEHPYPLTISVVSSAAPP